MTLIKTKFDGPSEFEIVQTPAKIPPLLAGHKLVLYGILKNKVIPGTEVKSRINGVASINGQVAGLKGQSFDAGVGYTTAFVIKPPLSETPDESEEVRKNLEMPLVHYFAAKSLLNDWMQDDGFDSNATSPSKKQDAIDLSISSGVICEHTSFEVVGEDEESSIDGAMCYIFRHGVQEHTSSVHSSDKEVKQSTGLLGAMKSLYKSVKSKTSTTDASSNWYYFFDVIISLQHATGYWSFKDLTEALKADEEKLQHKAVSSEVWGTLIALSLLEKKYEKREWELMALKAEKWLSNQDIPGDLNSLRSIASLSV